MKRKTLSLCLLLAWGISARTLGQNSPSQVSYANDWVATDAVGRTLPTYADVGGAKSDKYIGVFYWLWHAYIRTNPIRNMTQALRQSNGNVLPIWQDWYWAEPENGYYHNSDPWVARRHLQLLANAGVDFIYIDYTNGNQGSDSFDSFMTVAMDMYNQGIPVPKIVFFINDEGGRTALDYVYNNVYKPQKYKPLWFMWGGKPLVMEGSIHASSNEILNFFTFRDTWAFNNTQEDYWNFVDNYPQHYSTHGGIPEQIVVSKSMGAPLISTGAVNDKGSSYTHQNGTPVYSATWETPRTPYGDYFEEQWSRAHQVNPSIVCVTGWNEWTAGQWESHEPGLTFMGRPCSDIGYYMVDEFNVEFNRDIEPVKGEFTDNYYYQMVSHIRRHKGMAPPQGASAAKTIAIDGTFTEWSTVTPVMKDMTGDTQGRNFKNVNNSAMYVNSTGRNDIVESRVTYDNNYAYFYVKCAAAITAHTDANWMLLYLDTDRNKASGWEGYDYVVNMGVNSATQTTVKRWNGSDWVAAGTADFNRNGNQLEIRVPNAAIGRTGTGLALNFHWNDNPQVLKNIAEFFTNGESAPDRRFNYAYSSTTTGPSQSPYAGVIQLPGTVEAENFDNGGEGIAYHDTDGGNLGSEYRTGEGVDIQSCTEGGYNVGWTNPTEWLEYTVNVTTAGSYNLATRIGSTSAGSLHVDSDGTNISGTVAIPNTGGFQTWQTVNTTVNLTGGQHVLRVTIDAGNFNFNKLTFTTNGSTGIVSGQIYRLVARHSGKVLDVSGCSTADGANVQQWSWLGGGCQRWKVEATDNGYYRLTAQHSNKVLEVSAGGTANGSNVQQWGWTGTNWQQWKIEPTDNGYYKLTARHTASSVLEVSGTTSTNDGANVQLWGYVGGSNQQWKLEVVGAARQAAEQVSPSKALLYLSPNPASESVQLNWEGLGEKSVTLSVVNAQGKLVHTQALKGSSHQLSTAHLSRGIYVVTVRTGNALVTKKLIISR